MINHEFDIKGLLSDFLPFIQSIQVISQLKFDLKILQIHQENIDIDFGQLCDQEVFCCSFRFNETKQQYEMIWPLDSLKLYIGDQVIEIGKSNRPIKINKQVFEEIMGLELKIQITQVSQFNNLYTVCLFSGIEIQHKNDIINQIQTIDQTINEKKEEIFTLIDPLTLKNIQIPARSYNCDHLQPFDLISYLNTNRYQSPIWKCPICRKQAFLKEIYIPKPIQNFITQINNQCDKPLKIYMKGNSIEIYDKQVIQTEIFNNDDIQVQTEPIQNANDQQPNIEFQQNDEEIQINFEMKFDVLSFLIKTMKNFTKDKKHLHTINKNDVQQLFEELSKNDINQFQQLLWTLFDMLANILPLKRPVVSLAKLSIDEPLISKTKQYFDFYKILFIPFMFWSPANERNVVKCLSKITLLKPLQNPIMTASTYFIYKYIHKKDIKFEFVYGKTFGYYIKKLPITEQSCEFTSFIENNLKEFPHLHLPQTIFDNKIQQRKYYKRLTSFYVGFFSWFNVLFIGNAFKQIFSPPSKIETLEEKACINLFVKEILMRILKGLKMNIEDLIKFYEIWDVNKVVLRMDKGYKYGKLTDQIQRFKQLIKLKKQKELQREKLRKQQQQQQQFIDVEEI